MALVSGVVIAVALIGGAAAKNTTKTTDRLPLAQMEADPSARLATLPASIPGPDIRMAAAGPFEDADGPPPFAGPPRGRPPFGPMAEQGRPGPGHAEGPRTPCRDPLAFARTLAAAETAIGIRTDQLDAWRAFTDALQAAAPPPPPHHGPKMNAARTNTADTARVAPDSFADVEALATHLKTGGEAGERLEAASTALKARLSADQLQRMARLGPALMPPPPPGAPAPGKDAGRRGPPIAP